MGTAIHGSDTAKIGIGTTGDLKRDIESVVAGTPLVITFAVAFPNANYVLPKPLCYDSSGNTNDCVITNKIAAGFTVTAVSDGTIEYIASKA